RSLRIENAIRIEKRYQFAAAQDELIDRKLRRVRNSFRMNDQEQADIIRDLVGGELNRSHIEIALQFAEEHPRLLILLLRHHLARHRSSSYLKRAHHADDWPLRINHARNRSRNIVFQKSFPRRRQKR